MAVPACVLAAAYFLVPVVSELPASLAGLKAYGAYIVLALGASVSLVFRRGRVVLALLTLALAYASYGPLLNDASAKLATPADVIKAADKALYRAKRGGRNQVSR